MVTPVRPCPPKRPYPLSEHGDTRYDDYYWMRDDTRSSSEVIEHLASENRYQEAMMQHTLPLQQQLLQEMKARIKEDDTSVPYQDGDFLYWHAFRAGQEYPLYYRQAIGSDQSLLLWDQNEHAQDQAYYDASAPMMSHDHQKFVIAEDITGGEWNACGCTTSINRHCEMI